MLVSYFELVAEIVRGGFREFVNYMEGPVFLERELMGLGMGGYW